MLHRRRLLMAKLKREPNYDIMVWAATGYDGVVRLNGADFQLTQDTDDTELWYGTAPSSVTAMDFFLRHYGGGSSYNSTSVYIKKVKFGTGMYTKTSNCTNIRSLANCSSSDVSRLELIDLTNLNTNSVTNMSELFINIINTNTEIKGVEDWNTSNVSNFNYCFDATFKNDLDLHKWIVKSGATITGMFGSLSTPANNGVNTKVYYTPGYWAVDPMTTLAADRKKPVVYPYHDITIAATSSYNGSATIDGNTVTLSKDNTLGIWYYDGKNKNMQNFLLNNAYITSVSFKDSFYDEDDVNFYRAFAGNTNLRSISFGDKNELNIVSINTLLFNSNNVSCIYGLNNIVDNKLGSGYYSFSGCSNIRYLSLPIWDSANNNTMYNFAYNCSNLIRINRFPGVLSGCNTTNTMTRCTELTTIDSSGPISETLSFADSPLNLASAKVILSALQQVTSETISFSTTTWGYILADDEAIELLETAYSNGWNSNEPDIQVVAQSGYDGVVRLNGANKQLTNISGTEVWYGSAGTVTAMDDFLKHRNSTYYNSTSTNIKSVRFGKNINTASCTTLFAAFDCGSSTNTLFTKMDVRHLNTSSVTNFQATFADMASSEKTIIGIEDWNVSSGTNFNYLFNAIYLGDITIDLHKWHISSSATITSMLGSLSQMGSYGKNPKFYYTPGYWGKDPMNDSNIAADRIKPTVYPYHDITIAGNSSFSGNILLNNEGASTAYTATMTRDNTLGIWYYDIPSNVSISSLNRMLYRSNDATVRDNVYSLSFAESIRSKLDYEPQVASYFGLFGMVQQCMAIRTVDIDALRGIKAGGANQMFYSNLSGYTSKLCCIYGLEGIIAYRGGIEGDLSGGNYHFLSCSSLRYLKLGEWNMFGYLTQCFYGCSNLIRINRFPGVLSGCNTTNAIGSCTALTTIDSSGPISETLSFADCPLNVASAKVILSALQTVSGKTLTFSSTTKTAINGDSEALSLVTVARNKGWTIPLN